MNEPLKKQIFSFVLKFHISYTIFKNVYQIYY